MPENEILIALAGGLVSLAILLWRIGRWQAKQEVYSIAHAKGIKDINTRLDIINGTVGKQGERIAHLEGQSE